MSGQTVNVALGVVTEPVDTVSRSRETDSPSSRVNSTAAYDSGGDEDQTGRDEVERRDPRRGGEH